MTRRARTLAPSSAPWITWRLSSFLRFHLLYNYECLLLLLFLFFWISSSTWKMSSGERERREREREKIEMIEIEREREHTHNSTYLILPPQRSSIAPSSLIEERLLLESARYYGVEANDYSRFHLCLPSLRLLCLLLWGGVSSHIRNDGIVCSTERSMGWWPLWRNKEERRGEPAEA